MNSTSIIHYSLSEDDTQEDISIDEAMPVEQKNDDEAAAESVAQPEDLLADVNLFEERITQQPEDILMDVNLFADNDIDVEDSSGAEEAAANTQVENNARINLTKEQLKALWEYVKTKPTKANVSAFVFGIALKIGATEVFHDVLGMSFLPAFISGFGVGYVMGMRSHGCFRTFFGENKPPSPVPQNLPAVPENIEVVVHQSQP